MSEKRKVLKAAGVVGVFTLLSRFTGLIRDSVLAAMLGARGLADTFLVAFEIPNMIRRVMGEGALSAFIVPLITKRRGQGGEAEGWRFFNLTANFLMIIAFAISFLGGLFSHEVYMVFGGVGQYLRGEKDATAQEHSALLAPKEIINTRDLESRLRHGADPVSVKLRAAILAHPQNPLYPELVASVPNPSAAALTRAQLAAGLNELMKWIPWDWAARRRAKLAAGLNELMSAAPLLELSQIRDLGWRDDFPALDGTRLQLVERPGVERSDRIPEVNRRILELAYPRSIVPGTQTLIWLGGRFTRIMAPFALGLTLAALMMGACHTYRSFAAPSFGAVMLNLTMIAVGGVALALKSAPEPTTIWLCWAVLAGAVLRIAIMAPTLVRHGWRWQPIFTFQDPDLFKLLRMMGLGVAGLSISQIGIITAGFFALYLGEGVKVYITYSNRLIQFPMALTATAVATAMLPQLAQFLIEHRTAELRDMMAFTKRLEMFLMMPATLGLMILGLPILELIFQRREWTAEATHSAYWALLFYAPALLPMGWSRLLIQLSYARQDLMTPLKAAAISVVVNVILNWLLAFHTPLTQLGIPQAGLAMAFTIAAFVNYWALAWYMRREFGDWTGENARIGETVWKTAVAALLACSLGWLVYRLLVGTLGVPHDSLRRALFLLPVIGLIAFLYFALARLFRVPDSDRATDLALKKLLRR